MADQPQRNRHRWEDQPQNSAKIVMMEEMELLKERMSYGRA
jgi:hypothetical protein